MKILKLYKGEAGYILIPENSIINVEETKTRLKGFKFILVRSSWVL